MNEPLQKMLLVFGIFLSLFGAAFWWWKWRRTKRLTEVIALEIYVNGLKVCTAGVEDFDLVSSSLHCGVLPDRPPEEAKMAFTAWALRNDKRFKWVHYKMSVGDKIEIRIVKTNKVDPAQELSCPGGTCSKP